MINTQKSFLYKLTAFVTSLISFLLLTTSTIPAVSTVGPTLVSKTTNSFKINAVFPKSGATGNKLQFMNTTTGKWYDFAGAKQNNVVNGAYSATGLYANTKYLVRLTYLSNGKAMAKDLYVVTSGSNPTPTTKPSTSSTQTVYWTPSGKVYHINKNCPTLSRSKNINSGTLSQCPKKAPCGKCSK